MIFFEPYIGKYIYTSSEKIREMRKLTEECNRKLICPERHKMKDDDSKIKIEDDPHIQIGDDYVLIELIGINRIKRRANYLDLIED